MQEGLEGRGVGSIASGGGGIVSGSASGGVSGSSGGKQKRDINEDRDESALNNNNVNDKSGRVIHHDVIKPFSSSPGNKKRTTVASKNHFSLHNEKTLLPFNNNNIKNSINNKNNIKNRINNSNNKNSINSINNIDTPKSTLHNGDCNPTEWMERGEIICITNSSFVQAPLNLLQKYPFNYFIQKIR